MMTIGQLSKAVNVPTSTVRYYERTGLLNPTARTDGNYRMYGSEALERLRFIRAAQGVGFTLEDVSELLQFRNDDADPCGEVQGIIGERLVELDERIADMRHLRTVMKSYLKRCRADHEDGHCEVIDDLSARSSSSARS